MKIVINILKILSLVALTALILIMLFIAAVSFTGIPRLSSILLLLAIPASFGLALYLEISAVVNWLNALDAKRKDEKPLSEKQSAVLFVGLVLHEAAIALLFGVRLGSDGGMLVWLMGTPIVLWLGVALLIKQLLAKNPLYKEVRQQDVAEDGHTATE